MMALRTIVERFRALFKREELDAELDEELQYHLDRLTEKNLQAGMERKEARRQAMIAFGGVERFKERTREERGVRPLEELGRDLRFAVRTLRKSPGVVLVTIVSLALGIGVSTSVFSMARALVLGGGSGVLEDPEKIVAL